ncbi:MAG: hypothetical protein WC374_11255 [Phycisphaerae bacterium]|jgi:phage terminase Nu1 subunit (DNA packaging protein)
MLGITDRQVRNLVKDGVFERTGRGQYDIDSCVFAYIRYLRETLKGDSESLTDQRTRLVRAQADKAELDLEVARGNNLPLDLCGNFMHSILNAVRSRLLAMASTLKTDIPGLDNETVIAIDNHIRDVLSEVSKTGIPANLSRRLAQYVGDIETAAPDDGEPVG